MEMSPEGWEEWEEMEQPSWRGVGKVKGSKIGADLASLSVAGVGYSLG